LGRDREKDRKRERERNTVSKYSSERILGIYIRKGKVCIVGH
jgi:hypothetical protein